MLNKSHSKANSETGEGDWDDDSRIGDLPCWFDGATVVLSGLNLWMTLTTTST